MDNNQTPLKAETVQDASEPTNNVPSSFPTPAHPTPRFLSRKGAIIALGFIALSFLAAFIAGGFMLGKNQPNSSKDTSTVSPAKTSISEAQDFFLFSIPKPLEKLTINDLPNNQYIENAVMIGDSLWFSGSGSVMEYDTKKGSIIGYSNPRKSYCTVDIVFTNGNIFTPCRIKNYNLEKFSADESPYDSGFVILQIDPKTHKLLKIFGKKEGLLSNNNYDIHADGDYIWIETFDGIGRINSKTGKVDYYKDSLGLNASGGINVNHIMVDKDYVWANAVASADATGAMLKFDKKTNKWTAYSLADLMEYGGNRFDLESSDTGFSAKFIPGGIQIAFRDGTINGIYDRLVEKQYIYTTNKWTKINEEPLTGEYYEAARKKLSSTYPNTESQFTFRDENRLTQIKMPGTNQTYLLDGRDNLILSEMVNDKRYVLTTGSIDLIDNTYPFRQLLIKIPGGILSDIYSVSPLAEGGVVNLLIDASTEQALLVDSACAGMGCGEGRKIWLIDLKNKKIIKTFDQNDSDIPDGTTLLTEMTMKKDGEILRVYNKENKEILNINLSTIKLSKTNT